LKITINAELKQAILQQVLQKYSQMIQHISKVYIKDLRSK